MDQTEALKFITRRHFFKQAGFGIGAMALANLLHGAAGVAKIAPVNPLAPRQPHFAPKAKRVIYLFMAGGPSHLDLFDPKPELVKRHLQPIPESFIKGERFAFIKANPKLLKSPFEFTRAGQAGIDFSSALKHLPGIADEIAVVRSMHTTQFNHAPGQLFMNTGHQLMGRPAMGSWLTYGLGSEADDLPAFVVLLSGYQGPDGGKSLWGSGFLPTHYQGVEFRSKGEPVLFTENPAGVSREVRRESLDSLRRLNEMALADAGDPEIATRIAAYEMAYQMQSSVPELTNIESEPQHIREMYGIEPGKTTFANSCLLARRLIERGVRFVQLYHRGWDHHGDNAMTDLSKNLPQRCHETEGPAVALVKDLKQRGLLDDTLIIWGGEFGRTPMREERGAMFPGRDHHPKAFSLWMAGGGIKRGALIGKTDEFGYNVIEDPISVHDLHATVLHLMGFDHTKLTYRFQGRDFRLTDVHGEVVGKLLA